MNFKILIFLFCICQSFISLAQEKTVDSLRIISLASESDMSVYDNPAKSLSLAEEAYELALPLEDDSLIALSLNRLGTAYWSLGSPMLAMQNIQASLQICEVKGYKEIQAKNLGNLGNVYSAAGFDLDAIDYFKSELKIQKKLKKNLSLFEINNNLGKSFLDLNYYDSAHFYLNEAAKYLDDESIKLSSILYFNLAEVAFEEVDFFAADSLLQLTFSSATKYGSKRSMARANQLMAELELARGNKNAALKYARLSYNLAEELQVKELIYLSSKTLSKCYASLKIYDRAYLANLQYEAYLDSVQNVTTKNELELLSYYQRLFKFRVLETENNSNEKLAEQRKWIIIGLGLIVISVGIMLVIIIRIRMKLEKQKEELESLNDFKTKVFGIVSHDLRSPMQAFVHSVDLLNQEMVTKEEIIEVIPELREKSQSLLGLLGNLLRWAGGQMESAELEREYFDLLSVMTELEEEFEERLKLKEIAFIYDDEMSFRLNSNREIVKIILRNLLVNAIKFSHEQSKIFIKAHDQDKRKVISVEDHGIGMDKETVDQLFSSELTSQLGTTGEQGSGLGLALCGDLIQRLGGSIKIDSEVNRGSAFHISLPDR
ncbi:MAG: ATP-binding protein [Ekhidna sp.]